jgi:short subunit dehydrogenase-like uncharacterized protein
VVLTTAGPYVKYGTPLVEACARRGVDYVDITGETPWVRDLIDRLHERAIATGARIVPFCGFDSVPSDLGTLMVVEHLAGELGESTRLVSASFALRGGLNGGTLDTALTLAEPARQREVNDVLLLNPRDRQDEAERARSADHRGVTWDEDRKVWLLPFMMASINTRVVRRSSALRAGWGEPYGEEFTYREAMEARSKLRARAIALGLSGFAALAGRRWGRRVVRRFGPSPGEGPSAETIERGFFRLRLVGQSAGGSRVLATMSADGDPGNAITVPILCESALLLATARDQLPGGADRAGVLTPATALGLPLLDRLRAIGFRTSVESLA